MPKRTPAGEYLVIGQNAATAALDAANAATNAAQAGDVKAAEAAAKEAEEQATIAEQAWEALEGYRKGRATDAIAKAVRHRDTAIDAKNIAAGQIKGAKRKAKEMAKETPAVFDQMADAPAELPAAAFIVEDAPEAEAPAVLVGEIVETETGDGPPMPPPLDVAGLAIPDASAAFPFPVEVRGETLAVSRTGFAEIDGEVIPEDQPTDFVAEAQKNAEAAELHCNSAKAAAAEGDASGARVSAMLAHSAHYRARNFAAAAREDEAPGAEDAQGYAEMAADYAAAAKGYVKEAEDREAAGRTLAAELADAAAVADAYAAAQAAEDAPVAPETPQDAQDVPEAAQDAPTAAEDAPGARQVAPAELWQLAPAQDAEEIDPADLSAPEDWAAEADRAEHDAVTAEIEAEQESEAEEFRPAPGIYPETFLPRHTYRQLRPAPAEESPDALADLGELTAAGIGEQETLFLTDTDKAERLAEIARDKAAEAIHWADLGRLADAILLAERATSAAELAEHFADTDPAPVARARSWAKAAAKAVDKAAG